MEEKQKWTNQEISPERYQETRENVYQKTSRKQAKKCANRLHETWQGKVERKHQSITNDITQKYVKKIYRQEKCKISRNKSWKKVNKKVAKHNGEK